MSTFEDFMIGEATGLRGELQKAIERAERAESALASAREKALEDAGGRDELFAAKKNSAQG